MQTPLQNPIWSTLSSDHANLALGMGLVKAFPTDVLPFAGCANDSDTAREELENLISPGQTVGILSVIPPLTPDKWALQKELLIGQYILKDVPSSNDERVEKLTVADVPAMLELTKLVYPAYFREGTAKLGQYFGVKIDGQLVAMAGIRMAFDGYKEISAVCCHPDFRGRGLAKAVSLATADFIVQGGCTTFLHTEEENTTARKLYESIGFELRAMLPFKVVLRV